MLKDDDEMKNYHLFLNLDFEDQNLKSPTKG